MIQDLSPDLEQSHRFGRQIENMPSTPSIPVGRYDRVDAWLDRRRRGLLQSKLHQQPAASELHRNEEFSMPEDPSSRV
jgi:hypothetical protein